MTMALAMHSEGPAFTLLEVGTALLEHNSGALGGDRGLGESWTCAWMQRCAGCRQSQRLSFNLVVSWSIFLGKSRGSDQ